MVICHIEVALLLSSTSIKLPKTLVFPNTYHHFTQIFNKRFAKEEHFVYIKAMTKLEKELYQDLEKNGYLTPYMFPMIGKDYGKKGLKKIVILAGYVFQDEYVDKLFSPYNDSWSQDDKNNGKQDFMRHAWNCQNIDRRKNGKLTPQKWFENQKTGLSEDDVIFATYSRCPSKKKYNSNKNILEVLGAPQNDLFNPQIKAWCAAYNSLQSLLRVAKPDELWILGLGVKELIGSWGNSISEDSWNEFEEGLNEDNCRLCIISLRKRGPQKKLGTSYADECSEIYNSLRPFLPISTQTDLSSYRKLAELEIILKQLDEIKTGIESLIEKPSKKVENKKDIDEILKRLNLFCDKMTRKRYSKKEIPPSYK